MKNIITAVCFIIALPFLMVGFGWYFAAYAFSKGKDICETFFEYLE